MPADRTLPTDEPAPTGSDNAGSASSSTSLGRPTDQALANLPKRRHYPIGRSRADRQMRMARYLKHLARVGDKRIARQLASPDPGRPLNHRTVAEWRRLDIDRFAQREQEAMALHADELEDLELDLIYDEKMPPSDRINRLRGLDKTGRPMSGAWANADLEVEHVAGQLRRMWEKLGGVIPHQPDPIEAARDVTPVPGDDDDAD